MTPPDPRALVAQAQQEAGRREGDEDLASLLHDLADALSTALDRIDALTAEAALDDDRIELLESAQESKRMDITRLLDLLTDIVEADDAEPLVMSDKEQAAIDAARAYLGGAPHA